MNEELRKGFVKRSAFTSVGLVVLAVLYASTLWISLKTPTVFLYAAGIFLFSAIRYFLSKNYEKPRLQFQAYKISVFATLCQAFIWGVWCGHYLRWNLLSFVSMISLLILSGISLSSTTTLLVSRRVRVIYLFLLLGVPLSINLRTVHSFTEVFAIPMMIAAYAVFIFDRGNRHLESLREWSGMNRSLMMERDLLRALVNAIPGKVSLLNSDLKYEDVSENLLSFIGMSREEIIGQPLGFFEKDGVLVPLVHSFLDSGQDRAETELELANQFGEKRRHLIILKRSEMRGGVVVVSIELNVPKTSQYKLVN